MRARSNGASRFASPDGVAAAARVPRRDEAADARALELLERPDNERSVLLKGGTIVTMDPMLGDLVGDVRVEGFPLTNTLATLVTFASRGNVDTVFVAGTLRKWRGGLVGHDLAKIQGTVESSRDYLLSAQGLVCDPFAEGGSKPINN
ncbi:MAG: hypothetical protein JO287_15995 [Pseudonocardiales bacterium]|nr:hypothetical protein [Pseudonocardiales bacterium]